MFQENVTVLYSIIQLIGVNLGHTVPEDNFIMLRLIGIPMSIYLSQLYHLNRLFFLHQK